MIDGDVYIALNYLSVSKPFELVGRSPHCGGTETWTIARLSRSDAQLLAQEGVAWHLNKEPDWVEFYRAMERLEAEADVRTAKKRLDALTASQETER